MVRPYDKSYIQWSSTAHYSIAMIHEMRLKPSKECMLDKHHMRSSRGHINQIQANLKKFGAILGKQNIVEWCGRG